ncbi:MAG: hydroxymethylglutaryl-CoA synthase [Myxococcota bacterium]
MVRMSGLSGLALYVPKSRVRLKDWCEWTGQAWPKIEKVVGDAFRVRAAHESVYTMAANAVLRLIDQYEIDPQRVGCLALGTESSTDNSAGAVIVKGMVDEALERSGRPGLSRQCEVPEFKHACLGGMYALKAALRFAQTEPDRVAIVVAADIAEYARGSSGEQTQGAGAVAMLVEAEPRLIEIDLRSAGSSSRYRAIDFRKPVARHIMDAAAAGTESSWHDYPVFNGRYSTHCYLNTVCDAVSAMLEVRKDDAGQILDDAAAILMHRPYDYMPIQALSMIALNRLLASDDGQRRLADLASSAGADAEKVRAELANPPDLFSLVQEHGLDVDPNPETSKVLKQFRNNPGFKQMVEDKMFLGRSLMRQMGNLYAAALPAWIGAALEEAYVRQVRLAERPLLAIGYGSGDAAEAWPMRVVKDWRDAAAHLRFEDALQGAQDLDQSSYEIAHDGVGVRGLEPEQGEFIVERVGDRTEPSFQDVGIEYYRYVA